MRQNPPNHAAEKTRIISGSNSFDMTADLRLNRPLARDLPPIYHTLKKAGKGPVQDPPTSPSDMVRDDGFSLANPRY
jgi:hypothetical protein